MIRLELQLAVASGHPASTNGKPETTVVARLQRSELFHKYRDAFEATTGLPLVLREAGSFRTPLQGSSRMNAFCALMTRTNQTCAACLRVQQRLEQEALLKPKTIACYAGLSESAVPVRLGNTVLGYLQTGQVFFRAPSRKHLRVVTRLLPADGATPREVESAYFRTRVFTRKRYNAIIRLLTIFAEHLSAVGNQELLNAAPAEPAAVVKGRAFIAAHSSDQLRLGDVARAVHMSSCYFCKMFRKVTGLTFTEYLARERVETVKQDLLNVQTRISEAAFAAGFQSLSQFNRVFRRVAGEAPTRYRDRVRGVKGKALQPAAFIATA